MLDKGLRPNWWHVMGLEVPGMGTQGCGYGISVSADGDSGLWIWEKGGPGWEKLPKSAEVPGYGIC